MLYLHVTETANQPSYALELTVITVKLELNRRN